MIVGCFVNCMLSYMSMHHFDEANKVIDFLIDNNYWVDPELFFRKAQVFTFVLTFLDLLLKSKQFSLGSYSGNRITSEQMLSR
jgi:hypothetical protein